MIHPSAVVEAGAELAAEVAVGPFSYIAEGVSIGSGSDIGPHVVIKGPCRIGCHNRIHAFASIGDAPQDLKYRGERSWLEIGDHNTIREYATINRGTASGGGVTRIGHHNLLMAYTHVAHDCQLGDHIVFSNGASLAGHVEIGDHAILAGFALVHQFCKIGEHAFIGMGAHVNKDIAPYVLASGQYATARKINVEGLRRRDFSEASIEALGRAYKLCLRAGCATDDEAVQALRRDEPAVEAFARFIEHSERGVARAPRRAE